MARWPFEAMTRLMVVGAHPDDLETLVGGTIYKLIQRGVEVVEVLCTAGDIGTHDTRRFTRRSLARTRRREARAAARVLGIGTVVFLGHRDGEVEPSLALRAELARQYRIHRPDVLMTFDPNVDRHPDHRAAGRAALDAVIPASMPLYRPRQPGRGRRPSPVRRVYLFSGGGRGRRDALYVDVTDVWPVRMKAVLEHASQWGNGARVRTWLEQLHAQRGRAAGVKYAEMFWQP